MHLKKNLAAGFLSLALLWSSFVPAGTAWHSSALQTTYGDVTFDDVVDAVDALSCLNHHVGLLEFNDEQRIRADVDGSHTVDPVDAMLILQFYVGICKVFPVEEQSPSESSLPESSTSIPPEPTSSSAPQSQPSSSATSSDSTDAVYDNQWVIDEFGWAPVSETDYWNYNQLNEAQKRVYRVLQENALAMPEQPFAVAHLEDLPITEISICYLALRNDHPEYFWLPNSYSTSLIDDTFYFRFTNPNESQNDSENFYPFSKQERDAKVDHLTKTIQEIFRSRLHRSMSDYERELALYQWLVEHCSYDSDTALGTVERPQSYQSYGALVDGLAVCEGYARAFQLLCYYAGINCTLVTGTDQNLGGHMWNMTQIGGDWYMNDVTWDDTDRDGMMSYLYFNQTTAVLEGNHIFDPNLSDHPGGEFNFNLPECTATQFNYYVLNHLIAHSADELQTLLSERILQAAADESHWVTVRCSYRTFEDYTQIEAIVNPIIQSLNQSSLPSDQQIFSYFLQMAPLQDGFNLSW